MSTRLLVLALLTGLISGCSGNSTDPTRAIGFSGLQLDPADGATAVPLDATVTLDFNAPMDRQAVQRGLHLISEADTARRCPDSSMHGESFDFMMGDRDRLAHLDTYHSTPGRFSWNDAGTYCTFRPDSLLRPQTRHMLHMGPTMLAAMRQRGCQWGDGQTTSWGDGMTHFRTVAASRSDPAQERTSISGD